MLGFFNNKNYSKKTIKNWSEKGKIEDLLKVLRRGNTLSKIRAIHYLESHNYMKVKNALNKQLESGNKFIALKACEIINAMGANELEKIEIQKVLKKFEGKEIEQTEKEDSIYFRIKDVK